MTTCKIGLGTVQWGLSYGIANQTGKVGNQAVTDLLNIAAEAGVRFLDTARAYGDAEAVLKRHAAHAGRFKVVTKTKPAGPGDIDGAKIKSIASALDDSINFLRDWTIEAILVHDCDSLFRPGGEQIWRLLSDLKTMGRIAKVGISVYSPVQTMQAMRSYAPDIVQLPFNIYDQRFLLSGTLRHLKERGVEVHARSAFLQGLLLMRPDQLPDYFHSIRSHHASLHRAVADAKLTPLAAALKFSHSQEDIDTVIVGCDAPQQLRQILAAACTDDILPPKISAFSLSDEGIVNPSRWRLAT